MVRVPATSPLFQAILSRSAVSASSVLRPASSLEFDPMMAQGASLVLMRKSIVSTAVFSST